MKPIKDNYWIEVEKETEDTINLNGVKMYRDTSYDPMKLARQYGTVYKTPTIDTEEVDIREGDKVWFHHFVATEPNKVDYADRENIYQATSRQVYLIKREGNYIPVGYWNFIEQEVLSSDVTTSGIIMSYKEEDNELHGFVSIPSAGLIEDGVSVGDKVLFSENSEYDMNIDGKDLLRMRDFDILASYGQ